MATPRRERCAGEGLERPSRRAAPLLLLALAGCACPPPPAPGPAPELAPGLARGAPRDPAAVPQPVEEYTCAREPCARWPDPARGLTATGFERVALQRGQWPMVAYGPFQVPDVAHPFRRLLGFEYEPGYVGARELNALVVIHPDRPPTVIRLDPDRPFRWPEDLDQIGGPCAPKREPARREIERLSREKLARDLQGLPPPEAGGIRP
ncbi:MAG: hypothetical protein AB7N76_33380 [Planctomycetota bacterium]